MALYQVALYIEGSPGCQNVTEASISVQEGVGGKQQEPESAASFQMLQR